jgi:predicted regulator of Ras-like GTPase activity (Roadblock/LC7/MglB family)
MSHDQQLRADRLVFYEKEIEELNSELDAFLELSKAKSAMLIDREGHLVTRRGESIKNSLDSVSALIAGSFAATREMARLMGEDEFAVLHHQGVTNSIQIQAVGSRTLLGVIFDGRTNLGLVRFYAQESVRRIREILDQISAQGQSRSANLDPNFSASAEAALDKLF